MTFETLPLKNYPQGPIWFEDRFHVRTYRLRAMALGLKKQ
jgi:hypothetical protein